MSKLKVAILEDEPWLLEDLKLNLEETGLVEVIAFAAKPNDFIIKMEKVKPEALILDIDLRGETLNGIDVANKFKLPVLFISGKTTEFNSKIEDIDNIYDFPVDRLKKPYSKDTLKNKLTKFIALVKALEKSRFVKLDFMNSKQETIDVSTIVYITSKGESSGNKVIYFTNRTPEILIDFTLSRIEEYGLSNDDFIEINRQCRVNRNNIFFYQKPDVIRVNHMNSASKTIKIDLVISEDNQPLVRKLLK